VSNPWSTPSSALIRNLQIQALPGPTCEGILNSQGSDIENQVCQATVSVPKDYLLSFSVRPTNVSSSLTNIIHFSSQNKNFAEFGGRMPSIFVIPGSWRLAVRIGDKLQSDWGFDTPTLPLNVFTKITISAISSDVKFYMNDSLVSSLRQPSERPFGKAFFFASNPWINPANGTLKEFSLSHNVLP
jgi:hypothetical protein